MSPRESEADARIVVNESLRQAGWDPADKSMVGTEVQSPQPPETAELVDRSHARPFEKHAPVYNLVAAAGEFGPDMTVGTAPEEIGWKTVPGHVRLTRDHFVARVEGHSMEPTIPDRSYCLFRTDRGGSREGKLVLVWHRGCSDPGLGGGVLGQEVHQHEGRDAGRRHVAPPRDPAETAQSRFSLQRPRLRSGVRGRPPRHWRVRLCPPKDRRTGTQARKGRLRPL